MKILCTRLIHFKGISIVACRIKKGSLVVSFKAQIICRTTDVLGNGVGITVLLNMPPVRLRDFFICSFKCMICQSAVAVAAQAFISAGDNIVSGFQRSGSRIFCPLIDDRADTHIRNPGEVLL